jgi:uncharacterized membrane protein (UPF0127 family)
MKQGYVCLNDNIFPTILALTPEEQSVGLMYQTHPPVMSFVYAAPQINRFWMYNTPCPLDIIFCCDGKVSQICRGEPNSTKIIGGDMYSDLVVECPYGTASTIGLREGQPVELVQPKHEELKKILAQQNWIFSRF